MIGQAGLSLLFSSRLWSPGQGRHLRGMGRGCVFYLYFLQFELGHLTVWWPSGENRPGKLHQGIGVCLVESYLLSCRSRQDREEAEVSPDRRMEDIKVSCLLWSVLLSCRSPARQRGYNSVVPVLLARQRGYNSVDLLTDFCSANRFDFCLNVL